MSIELNMKDQITKITLDCMLGIRDGVGQCRVKEFTAYLDNLIEAKGAGIDPGSLQWPMLSDNVQQGVEAALSARSAMGAEGGLQWSFISLGGQYEKDQSQGIRVKVDMAFKSAGAPDFDMLKAMSVDDLKKLQGIVNPEPVTDDA